MKISVIIPALNEEALVQDALRSCRDGAHEIIVVDGGSTDQTVARASRLGASVLSSPPGRGRQQHAGALAATGDVLLFLHADALLPPDFPCMIRQTLHRPGVVFGAFQLAANPPSPALAAICFGANLRTRLFAMPYGDQAIFVWRDAYMDAGGFAPMPIMEDVDLVRRLNKAGGFRMARCKVLASARRWKQDGLLKRTLGNYSLILRHLAGVPPERLASRYRDVR